MYRKLFAWLMTFAMLLSLCPAMSIPAGAAETSLPTPDDYTIYYRTSDGEPLTIDGCSSEEDTKNSCWALHRNDENSFDDISHLFQSQNSLTEVSLPASLTSIGERAFVDCLSLESITLPTSLQTIGENAFSNCSSLASIITLPATLTSIGGHAFACCEDLSSVTIQGESLAIGEDAFANCGNLLYITSNTPLNGNSDYETITVTQPESGGTLSAKMSSDLPLPAISDTIYYHSGLSVTVTATPAAGYKLDKVYVNDSEDGVTVSGNTANFYLPGEDITITATFAAAHVATHSQTTTFSNQSKEECGSQHLKFVFSTDTDTAYKSPDTISKIFENVWDSLKGSITFHVVVTGLDGAEDDANKETVTVDLVN